MRSYSTIYNLGHRELKDKLQGVVAVEEKIDGSQISFGVYGGDPRIRSKGSDVNLVAPEKMFAKAVEVISDRKSRLVDGYTYRGEYLSRPKHNALAYDRIPRDHVIIFDVDRGDQDYVIPALKESLAADIDFECVPRLFMGQLSGGAEQLRELLECVSVLGGQKIEGFVIKPIDPLEYGGDKKLLMAKFVSEAFKEVHSGAWKAANPSQNDIIERIGDAYTTAARWQKAVQHLRERGLITDTPQDIGILMKEVNEDVLREEEAAIKEALWKAAWPKVSRRLCRGLPDWYKDYLMRSQFGNTAPDSSDTICPVISE